jgi:branched-chain amino acid transport system substrate-binding protein
MATGSEITRFISCGWWPGIVAATGLVVLATLLPVAASAAGITIGVAAPLSGPMAILGQQISNGARAAAADYASGPVQLETFDDTCTAEGGANAARRFVAQKVQVVIGFLCTEAIEAAMPVLKKAGVPVITVGVRTDSLTDRREKTGWPVFRLGPRADGERTAAGALLVPLWRDELFAIVDDGTIYGRELAESFRLAAEQAALKPVFVDTFRPELDNQIGLAGRLRKAGATHVFVGGDREDIAILGRDARWLNIPLTIAGGESLRAASEKIELRPGTLMVGLPEWSERAPAEALASLKKLEIEPDGYVLPAYTAIGIAAAAVTQAQASGKKPIDILSGYDFDTALGTVRFDAKGDLSVSPYRLFRYDGARFVEVE